MAATVRMLFWGLLVLFFLTACNGIDGKVEKRGNLFFLVNTSTSKKYRFTVKRTEAQDGKIHRYTTEFHELEPGEEVHIGEDAAIIPAVYPLKQQRIMHFQKPLTKEELRKRDKEIDELKRSKKLKDKLILSAFDNPYPTFDTIINGQKMEYYSTTEDYYDKTLIIPSKSYKYKYEVKGQVEIKQ